MFGMVFAVNKSNKNIMSKRQNTAKEAIKAMIHEINLSIDLIKNEMLNDEEGVNIFEEIRKNEGLETAEMWIYFEALHFLVGAESKDEKKESGDINTFSLN